MKKIILVRHAESEMNKLGMHQGQLHDGELSPEGIEQAELLSNSLKSEFITEVYSSDMKRTLQTANILAQRLGGKKVNADKRLREFTMGEFDNFHETRDLLFKEFYDKEILKGKSKYEIRPPGGENIWDFIERIKSFIEDVKDKDGTILIVSHGGTNEVFINILQGLDKYHFRRYHQDNTCVNEIIYDKNKWNIISINKISHLKKLIKPEKKIYPNQDKIKKEIFEKIKDIFKERNVFKAYLFGSLAIEEFGKYSEKYGRHKGSNINILAYLKSKEIPKEWKYINQEKGFWDIYEIGKYEVEGIKHKIDLFIVTNEEEQIVKEKTKELGWNMEEII